MIKASACAKTILAGEHAVVYGAKAIAIPVHSLRAEVRAMDCPVGNEPTLLCDGVEINKHHDIIAKVLERAKKLLNCPSPMNIETSTSIPLGAGLGSSAALSVALVRCLSQKAGTSLTTEKISELSLELEKNFHGSPSGLDTTVVSYEKPILFEKGPKLSFIDIARSEKMYFALIDTGERASTKEMIEVAKPYFMSSKSTAIIKEFNTITALALDGIKSGCADKIRESFELSSQQLDKVGVVTKHMKEIMSSLRGHDLFSKPTGAGGGGMILTYLPSAAYASELNVLRERFGDGNVFLAEC